MALVSLLLLTALLPYLGHSASVHVGIINGTEARPHSRPYMVSIQVSGYHICGGFLVSSQFVMTAAHCWDSRQRLTAVLGAHDLKDGRGSVQMEVESYYLHPYYNPDNCDYDILLLKLSGTAPMGPTIRNIAIPQRYLDIPANTICSAAGWGQTGTIKPGSDRLLETVVRIVDDTECRRIWWPYVNQLKVCTLHPGGICMGDSGGPLVCGNTAVGITSFVQKNMCDQPNLPNVFAKISAFLPWIKSIVGNV
ncbi:mast cell protease 4-like [Salminus brasiliensis]|uniref:mast cell protease 4-like n=1 Tax=Salminus brasiliensis TaxID=930266 RepID=UPI003B834D0B